MWGLLLANICFSGVIYFYPFANFGIGALNSGFIMSQLGQEFKKFLIIINNNHTEQLTTYKTLSIYSKLSKQIVI